MRNWKRFSRAFIFSVLCFCYQQVTLADNSPTLYSLKTSWLDIDNQPTDLALARGSLAIIAMVYTSCPHACPMTITKIQEVERAFSKAGVENVRFIMASFDFKNDKPQKLKKYQKARKLDVKKWKFLSPKSESDARELAVALGISYKDLGDGDFSHSNVITLIDEDGHVLATIDNLNAEINPLLAAALAWKNKVSGHPK